MSSIKKLTTLTTLCCISVVQGQKLYYNSAGLPTPLFRYTLWSELDADLKNTAAAIFGYNQGTWENDPFAAVERTSFLDLSALQIDAALGMGYVEDTWDLFINHFDDYDWKDLVGFEVVQPFLVLGWTEQIWKEEKNLPASEDKDYFELTDAEKQAAADIGHFEESWDKKNLPDFIATSVFLNTPDPAVVTAAPTTAPASGGGFCFPGSVRVTVKDKGPVLMDQVKLGDKVLVSSAAGNDTYETVYSFGHYDRDIKHLFVQIFTDNKNSLELSSDHMVFSAKKGFYTPASTVEVGDKLFDPHGNTLTVQKISTVTRQGAYAPFTASGKLIINNVLVSSYVSFQESAFLTIGGIPTPVSFQWLAHAFGAPQRFYCKYFTNVCATETYTTNGGVSTRLEIPFRMTLWIFEQNAVVIALCMTGVTFLFSIFTITESSTMMAAIGIGAAAYYGFKQQRACVGINKVKCV